MSVAAAGLATESSQSCVAIDHAKKPISSLPKTKSRRQPRAKKRKTQHKCHTPVAHRRSRGIANAQSFSSSAASDEHGLQRSPAKDPIARTGLQEPVCRRELARLYGLDLTKLDMLLEQGAEDAGTRAAIRDLDVLEGIVNYLESARKEIHQAGDVFQIHIPQLPCRILALEKMRFENLLRANHKFRRDFTNVGAGILYRCPLPGCGGPTLNQASVKRALLPHCRAYRNADEICFAVCIDAKRGREMLLFPPSADSAHTPDSLHSTHPPAVEGEIILDSLSPASTQPSPNRVSPQSVSHKRIIEICTQDTQDKTRQVVQTDRDNTRNLAPTAVIPIRPQGSRGVQEGYAGLGVHALELTEGGQPLARELAAPTSHYAKRNRGPDVAAESLVLRKMDTTEFPPERPHAVCRSAPSPCPAATPTGPPLQRRTHCLLPCPLRDLLLAGSCKPPRRK